MIYLFWATIILSFSFGLIKNQITALPVFDVAFCRLFIASITFLPVYLINLKKHDSKDFLKAFFIGIIQFGLMYIFFLKAFKYLQGSQVVMLTASTPIFVTIFASILNKKTDYKHFLCILTVVAGALIAIKPDLSYKILFKGMIFMELANISFAIGQVLWKKYIKETTAKSMFPAYFGASFIVLIFCITSRSLENFYPSATQIFALLYLGIIQTAVGFWLWNKGAKKVSYLTLSVMNNLKIPFGVLFAVIFFNEKINFVSFSAGFLIIISAIIYSVRNTD